MTDPLTSSPAFEDIRTRYVAMLDERHAALSTLRDALDAPQGAHAAALAEIESILHQIAGTAGIMGFGALGARAREIEDRIAAHLKAPHDAPETPARLAPDLSDFLKLAARIARTGA